MAALASVFSEYCVELSCKGLQMLFFTRLLEAEIILSMDDVVQSNK